jgi:hypothetical protein
LYLALHQFQSLLCPCEVEVAVVRQPSSNSNSWLQFRDDLLVNRGSAKNPLRLLVSQPFNQPRHTETGRLMPAALEAPTTACQADAPPIVLLKNNSQIV